MLSENNLPNNLALNLTGRVLFTGLFWLSGVTHFTNIPYYVGLIPEGFPFAVFWVLITGVIELAGINPT